MELALVKRRVRLLRSNGRVHWSTWVLMLKLRLTVRKRTRSLVLQTTCALVQHSQMLRLHATLVLCLLPCMLGTGSRATRVDLHIEQLRRRHVFLLVIIDDLRTIASIALGGVAKSRAGLRALLAPLLVVRAAFE